MAYADVVLADSPLLYWRLGDASGTTATDSSGNARHGTYSGSPTLGATGLLTGDADKAATFDGIDDYVSRSAPATTSAFTIEFWVKNPSGVLATRYPSTTSDRMFFVGLGSGGNAGKVSFIVRNAAGVEATMFGATILGSGTRHVVCTYDGAAARIYVNGALDGTSTAVTGALVSTTNALEIGARTAAPSFSSGTFDEVAYYGTALSATRIAAHYTAGTTLSSVTVSPGAIGSTSTVYSPTLVQPVNVTLSPGAVASTSQVFGPTLALVPEWGPDADTYDPPASRLTIHTRPEVKVGGHWLSSLVPYWGELKTGTRRNGDWECSFSIAVENLGSQWRHPALVYGAPVEVRFGPDVEFVGTLTEPDWDTGQMVALGACREAENAMSMTATQVSTTAPNTAIDAAIARGALSWNRVGDFGTTPVGVTDDSGGLYSLRSVLDAWAEETSGAALALPTTWAIDRKRSLVIRTMNEAAPKWFIVPGSGVMGSADDERVDRVFVRYVSNSRGRLATASYPASTPALGVEKPVDITDRGAMTQAKAEQIAQGIWNDLQGRSGWTNGLTLKRGQVTTPGGVIADLRLIKAGDTVRLLGVPDPRSGIKHNLDVVIGDTLYDWTEDEIQINPVGMAARDQESVLEQVGNLALEALGKAAGGGANGGDVLASLTAAAGWTLQAARYIRYGPFVVLYVELTRTGGTITVGTGGNISPDVAVLSGIPAEIRPATTQQGVLKRGAVLTGFCEIDAAGAIAFTDGPPSATFANAADYRIHIRYALGL